MANIQLEDSGNLSAILTIILNQEDYLPQINTKLKKLRKDVAVKGFRKGKTPISYVKKLYGKQIMLEEINTILADEITQYLKDNDLDILGQPLPTESQGWEFDINNPTQIEFNYELGLAPKFELKGFDENTTVKKYLVQMEDEDIDTEVNNLIKQRGTQSNPEDDIAENDVIRLELVELDGEEPKEEGFNKEVSSAVDLIKNEELKAEILLLKKGDTFTLNVYDLEDRETREFNKFVLGLDQEEEIGPMFSAVIKEVTRHTPAEINQAFFDGIFGPDVVKSEAEMREKIKESMENQYDSKADGNLLRDIQNSLIEQNALELPNEFLKKWLKANNDKLTDESLEQEYDEFAKGLRWTLIQNKIAEANDLEVTREDLVESFKNDIRNYFRGNLPEENIGEFANKMLEDEQAVRQRSEQLMSLKLFDVAKEKVKIEEETIDRKSFDELFTK